MESATSFAAFLRRQRQASGLTQEGLAERARLSARAISDLERGLKETPHATTVHLLIQALELDEPTADAFAAAARRRVLPSTPAQRRGNLPVAATSFVGRQQACAEVKQALATARLLTLIGAGGVGKTRLALEVAASVADNYADGIWLVELANLADVNLVPQTVASTLGVREQPQTPILQILANALRTRRLLLILDNCEHVVSACADLANALVRSCPEIQILATSREVLGIESELVWSVPVLRVPDLQRAHVLAEVADSEAVRLFVERARRVAPSFALDELTTLAVGEVCVRLDGIPLAIELAAARVRTLGVNHIATRLDDVFRLRAGGRRTAPRRQQTLRATIDWSYELLSAIEQRLFDQLSVFRGGWTLEAAEAVCGGDGIPTGEVPDVLSRLVDKSLIVADPGPGGTIRYRFLETIRQYAGERLELTGGTSALSQCHMDWYVAVANRALNDYWWGANVVGWLEQLSQEQANFRSALRFAIDGGKAESGLHLAAGLWVLWGFRGSWAEGRDWIARLLALDGAGNHPGARADALSAAGQMAFQQGDYASAQKLLTEAVDVQRQVRDTRGLAMAVTHAGLAARGLGQYTAARAFHEEAAELSRAAGNQGYEAANLGAIAHAAYLQGEHDVARTLATEELAILNTLSRGRPLLLDERANIPLFVLGRVALCASDYTAARRHLQENLAQWRMTGDARSAPGALVGLACVAVAEGQLAEAQNLLLEGLAVSEQLGSRVGLVQALEGFAILAAAENQPERAVRLASAAASQRVALHNPISPAEHALVERWLAPARRALGDRASTVTSAAGAALSAEQAVADIRSVVLEDQAQD